jgi:hypothetical protein
MAKGLGKKRHGILLDSIFKTLANIYVSLHTGDPGSDGQAGNEATGSGYARATTAPADWNIATDAVPAVTDNANDIVFPTALGDWSGGADFTHVGLWTTLAGTTEAEYIGRGLLTTAKPVTNGDTAQIAAGALDIELNETA